MIINGKNINLKFRERREEFTKCDVHLGVEMFTFIRDRAWHRRGLGWKKNPEKVRDMILWTFTKWRIESNKGKSVIEHYRIYTCSDAVVYKLVYIYIYTHACINLFSCNLNMHKNIHTYAIVNVFSSFQKNHLFM